MHETRATSFGASGQYVHLGKSTATALGVNATCPCGGGPGAYPTVRQILARLVEFGYDLRLVTS